MSNTIITSFSIFNQQRHRADVTQNTATSPMLQRWQQFKLILVQNRTIPHLVAMYELTKQKSRGYWIVFGIIVFAFITAVLKMAIPDRPANINDDLIKAANDINKHAPIIIDSTTRFDYVNALSGNIFQYNYTLLTLDRMEVDTILLKSSGRASMIQHMKENPKSSVFRDNNIEIQARYLDKNGIYVTTISVHPNEY